VTKADEDAIREIELRFNQAWGQHDPDAMVESLVDDAQFVTVNGAWTKSRDGFRDLMRRLHGANGPFRSSTRETPEMHVRFLAPDVAVMHSRFHIYGDVDESERTSIGTRVVRKVDGRWRTVAVQNTDVRAGRRHYAVGPTVTLYARLRKSRQYLHCHARPSALSLEQREPRPLLG